MNAKQLMYSDGRPTHVWVCSSCGVVYNHKTGCFAESCCKCAHCGVGVERGMRLCDPCNRTEQANRELDRYEKAELVEDYDGPVYVGDRYFESAESAADHYASDGDDVPEFAFCCHVLNYELDAEMILQNLLENSGVDEYEYGEVVLVGEKEFVAACDSFNEANKGTTYWDVDYKRKVRLLRTEDCCE